MAVIYDQEIAKDVATRLLAIDAVKLQPANPFTWSSGIISPIYCDNRLTLSFHGIRRFIGDAFADVISERAPTTKKIAGIATGAIAHAQNAADELEYPLLYVREKPKAHGRKNQVEGLLNPGDHVFVIEDLISTGGSSKRAVDALIAEGATITGLGAIVTYGLPDADAMFKSAEYPVYALTDFDTIIDVAAEQGSIAPEQMTQLREWKKDPRGWKGPQ